MLRPTAPILAPFVRATSSTRQRPAPTTSASTFGLWTREPRAGQILRLTGHSDQHYTLPKRKEQRADGLAKWLGPDLPKATRDSVIAEVLAGQDDGRSDFVSRWLLSNERVDSYDTTLAWDGWQLGDFKRNPVVLLAHDSFVDKALPIGEDVGAYMDPVRKALIGITRYVSEEVAGVASLEARAVRWIRFNLLRGVSVGFEPEEWEVAEDRDTGDSWWVPINFKRQALKEYSPTPVPANPDSLGEGRGLGSMKPEEVERFADDLERVLDSAGWLAIPRATIETMRSAIRGTRLHVDLGGTKFVVARAEDVPAASEDPTAPANQPDVVADDTTDGDPEEELRCPGCGWQGPESSFVMNESRAAEEPAQPAAVAEEPAAAQPTHGALDGRSSVRDAHAHAALLAGEVLDALDFHERGQLP